MADDHIPGAPALEARAINVRFGGVRAIDDVHLTVGRGEIVGVVGPNGSGKTSLLNALTGVVAATGSLRASGAPVPLGAPERSRRAGLVRTFQAPQIIGDLSCIENVMLSSPVRRWRGLTGSWLARPWMWRAERDRWSAADQSLEMVGLAGRGGEPGHRLTYGEQRLLELARAIAAVPGTLLLDEPSAGLNDRETSDLADLLTLLNSQGVALVVVDHKIDFIDRLSDRIIVLELGSVVAEGAPADVWRNERVVDAYLGAPSDA